MKLVRSQPIDLVTLRAISRERGGYRSSRIRALVWPKLLGIDSKDLAIHFSTYLHSNTTSEDQTETLEDSSSSSNADANNDRTGHRDLAQVRCDVERSLHSIYQVKHWTDEQRSERRKVLTDIIIAFLNKNGDNYYYYQGFHDVVTVFLLVAENDNLAFSLTEQTSRRYLADYMQKDFSTMCQFMPILMELLRAADGQLHSFLAKAGMECFFATSWLITWFAHDVKSLDSIARIFDYLVCLKKEILRCECDFAVLHNFLVKSPERYQMPIEKMIKLADKLWSMVPLTSLVASSSADIKILLKSNRVSIIADPLLSEEDVVADTEPTALESLLIPVVQTYPNLNYYHLQYWRKAWTIFMCKIPFPSNILSAARVKICPTEKVALDLTQQQSSKGTGQSDNNNKDGNKGGTGNRGGRMLLYVATAIAAVSVFTYSYGHRLQQWIPKRNKVFIAVET
eukprot:gene22563-30832_t